MAIHREPPEPEPLDEWAEPVAADLVSGPGKADNDDLVPGGPWAQAAAEAAGVRLGVWDDMLSITSVHYL